MRGPLRIILEAHRFASREGLIYTEASLGSLGASGGALGPACYAGEVVCRNLGGTWHAPDGLASEFQPRIRVPRASREAFVFDAAARGQGLALWYRALKAEVEGVSPERLALSDEPPRRQRWVSLWLAQVGPARERVEAVLTEIAVHTRIEARSVIEGAPALVGRFEDLELAALVAERLLRCGAEVDTRDILTEA
jgi:hypothetical protein